MSLPLITTSISYEQDLVAARRRAKDVAELLGFDQQDQTRISTAVSEIGRNAFRYAGGGKVEFEVEGSTVPQILMIRISDQGPGIADLPKILRGSFQSSTGMGLGIAGTRQLMDQFDIESPPGKGTTVTLKKFLPRRAPLVNAEMAVQIAAELAKRGPSHSPYEELRRQNQELLYTLEELRRKQEELTALNHELEDTNRGVVALYAELDEKADHLRRADELKTRFLSNMSHEFRTPVNSILALSNLLLNRHETNMTPSERQEVEYIRKSADGLLELVNDLLDIAKVEAGKVQVRPVEVDVAMLFSALRGMLRPLLLNPHVQLIVEEPLDIPKLFTDESKVSQILRNLISNALKFTEQGEVRVSARREGDAVVFAVADTGCGIAPENHQLIFQEFSQVDNAMQRTVKGTGLGLPLSRRLAELLGGRLWVKSALHEGSSFYASIPLVYRSIAPANEGVWEVDPQLTPVLLVEDSIESRLLCERYLAGTRFQILWAATVRDARQALELFRPAVILLDVLLQGEDTWALLGELKSREAMRTIPVIVQTVVDDSRKAFALGADAFLRKPFDRDALVNALETATGGRPCVLIVDDDETSRYLMRQVFRESPCTVLEAADGREALRMMRQHNPKLVTLDLAMPGLAGLDVLKQMKGDEHMSSIPVAVVTSRVLGAAEREQLSERAEMILSKAQLGDIATHAAIVSLLR